MRKYLWWLFFLPITGYAQFLEIEQFEIIIRNQQDSTIPASLLYAVGMVESGGYKGIDKPWPWTINYAKGSVRRSMRFNSKDEAVAYTEMLLNTGVENIDIGTMQINWYWHNKKFSSLEQAFGLENNIKIGLVILSRVVKQHGPSLGIKQYHGNSNVSQSEQYLMRVMQAWGDILGRT